MGRGRSRRGYVSAAVTHGGVVVRLPRRGSHDWPLSEGDEGGKCVHATPTLGVRKRGTRADRWQRGGAEGGRRQWPSLRRAPVATPPAPIHPSRVVRWPPSTPRPPNTGLRELHRRPPFPLAPGYARRASPLTSLPCASRAVGGDGPYPCCVPNPSGGDWKEVSPRFPPCRSTGAATIISAREKTMGPS